MWVMWEIPPLLMVVLPGTQTYEFSRLYSCCGKIKSPLKAKPVEKQQHSMNSIHSSSDTKYVHLVYLGVDTVFLWGRMLSWPLVLPYRSADHASFCIFSWIPLVQESCFNMSMKLEALQWPLLIHVVCVQLGNSFTIWWNILHLTTYATN